MKFGLKSPDAERTAAPQSVKMLAQTARPQWSFDQHGRVLGQAALFFRRDNDNLPILMVLKARTARISQSVGELALGFRS